MTVGITPQSIPGNAAPPEMDDRNRAIILSIAYTVPTRENPPRGRPHQSTSPTADNAPVFPYRAEPQFPEIRRTQKSTARLVPLPLQRPRFAPASHQERHAR